jgi:glycerate kinase
VVQQGVRDAQFGGQFTHLRVQAAAGEEVDRTVDDLLLALGRTQALSHRGGCGSGSAGGRGAGLCGVDHLVNSAEIVDRLINMAHSHKPWRFAAPVAGAVPA